MDYWICVTNKDTWEIVKKKNVWGLPEARVNMIKRMKPQDKAVIYVTQSMTEEKEIIPPRIKGLFKVVSEPYQSKTKIFPDRLYPNRVNLEPEIVLEKEYLEFRPLIPKLDFIKNKQKWSGSLRSGLARITSNDYELIKSNMEKIQIKSQ